MTILNGLFTSEAVSAGHPDKLCDRISDTLLDAFLQLDPHARVACETLAAHGKIVVAGEFRTARHHFNTIREHAESIVRQTLRDVGYSSAEYDIDPDDCAVEILFNRQSREIAASVDGGTSLGAGDQGLMFGYATRETLQLMPLAWSLATDLIAEGTRRREEGFTPLRSVAKSQVTVRYEQGRPVGVQAVVISWQHLPEVPVEVVRDWLRREVLDVVVPLALRTTDFRCFLNPAGPWTVGGPKGDTGLTGRKIIVDSYGGSCPHGGGAFSGKDPSKVDRSGAYAARWVALNVVAANLAERCTVQLAYAIGVAEPVSVAVDTHRTGTVGDEVIGRAIQDCFDLTPGGIISALNLLRSVYADTSSLGHFGRWRDPEPARPIC